MQIGKVASFQNGYAFKSKDFVQDGNYKIIKIKELKDGKVVFFNDSASVNIDNICDFEKYIVENGDILFALTGDPVNKNNPLSWVGRVSVYENTEAALLNQRVCKLIPKKGVNKKYLYYYFREFGNLYALASIAKGSASQANISTKDIEAIDIELPPITVQNKVVGILDSIENKINVNNMINNNLEQQASALFVNMFGHSIDSLDNSDIKLGDLIESVDNRGKTPPLSDEPTDYPIIDVRALSGNSRIIDYANCTKYVSKETYNNWFRSGHPKEYDILISTVGSLAEIKIFLGTTGCIAQNVVGFRTKGISPLYLYQYLNYIKNDLVAYNIGSVQPSIKVTHIIKHSIYVASKEDIEIFDSIARDITKKIFANCQENEALKQMRDTLLPKLMSGVLDVSNIEI